MTSSTLSIRRTSTAVGAEIQGVDLTALSGDEFKTIRSALADYGVIFFRNQQLSPEDHIAFAERWGEININRFFTPVEGYPQIAEVLKEPDQTVNIGGGWHTDHSYDTDPAMGSILYAHEVPATGGDTLFASMSAAFDALSGDFQKMLEGLTALHSSRHVFGAERQAEIGYAKRMRNADQATQDVEHPVVIRHPESGKKCLYVNPGFTRHIIGWSAEESANLLEFLYNHAMHPQFATRFNWQVGSVAMWDNRATWHNAINDYHGMRRHMHRITVAGVPLSAAA